MVNEIVLHAGLHKTGTSSIQQTLHATHNRLVLRNQGVLYPASWPQNHSIPLYSAFCERPEAYHINIRRGYSGEQIEQVNKEYLAHLAEEVSRSSPDRMLLCGEDVSVLSLEGLSELQAYLLTIAPALRVINYVRHPVEWAVSGIQEDIKHGVSYGAALESKQSVLRNLFRERVGRLLSVFGPRAVTVYRFEDAVRHGAGLVGHFLAAAEVAELEKIRAVRANESMSQTAGDLLSHINRREPVIVDGRLNPARSPGDDAQLVNLPGPPYDIPWEDKMTLAAVSKEDAAWLSRNLKIDYLIGAHRRDIKGGLGRDELLSIVHGFKGLSPTLGELVIEYLELKAASTESADEKSLIQGTLKDLGSRDTSPEHRLFEVLGIPKSVPMAELYRELGLFLEQHGEIGVAKKMMDMALVCRPSGPFISQKSRQYEQMLNGQSAKHGGVDETGE
jgi:hypothetical protein